YTFLYMPAISSIIILALDRIDKYKSYIISVLIAVGYVQFFFISFWPYLGIQEKRITNNFIGQDFPRADWKELRFYPMNGTFLKLKDSIKNSNTINHKPRIVYLLSDAFPFGPLELNNYMNIDEIPETLLCIDSMSLIKCSSSRNYENLGGCNISNFSYVKNFDIVITREVPISYNRLKERYYQCGLSLDRSAYNNYTYYHKRFVDYLNHYSYAIYTSEYTKGKYLIFVL
ncbi:MAG: hypothetical protein ABEK36_05665, partial [Candidatus Aenigmatarchaeota archaeon]